MAKLEISVNLNETRYNGSNQIFKILCFEHLYFYISILFSQISILISTTVLVYAAIYPLLYLFLL